jgi:hypothetical protein
MLKSPDPVEAKIEQIQDITKALTDFVKELPDELEPNGLTAGQLAAKYKSLRRLKRSD